MFHGSIVALITPMFDDGEVDYQSLEQLVDWHLESGTDGLVLLGTTGEFATVEDRERERIVSRVIAEVDGKIPVIIGTGVNSTRKAITMTRLAMEWGADAALLVVPYYNKPTQEGLYQHFRAVAEAVPIPQILYNVPARTACDLLPETVQRLSHFSNIVALKEATGDIARLNELLKLDMEIDMLSGDDRTALDFMLAGGKGMISVAANVAPSQMHELCQFALSGDEVKAREIDHQLQAVYQQLTVESNPIPTKWVLAEMGRIKRGIRLPLTPLNQRYTSAVREAMKTAGIV